MNFFQEELRSLFRGRKEFQNVKYIGRACYVPLPNGIRIKAEFVTGIIGNQFDALRVTAINKAEGTIDTQLLRFSDYFSKVPRRNSDSIAPYIWVYSGKSEWYIAPSGLDKSKLTDAVCEYINVFSAEQQQENSIDMSL